MKRLILLFVTLLLWCGTLVAVRVMRSDSRLFAFLLWNLFLAAVPFAASLVVDALAVRGRAVALQVAAALVWLLFLPNAPYILTDFIHLHPRQNVPLWYDLLLLTSCAGTGLLLGYASTLIVHRAVEARFGCVIGWSVAVVAQLLSAFGVYLGRFVRFNSWDVVTDPVPLFADIAYRLTHPTAHPRTFAVTALFGVMLTLGYVALHVLASLGRRSSGRDW